MVTQKDKELNKHNQMYQKQEMQIKIWMERILMKKKKRSNTWHNKDQKMQKRN